MKNCVFRMKTVWLGSLFAVILAVVACDDNPVTAALLENFVVESAATVNAFPVVAEGRTADLLYDADDFRGVIRAIGDLQADIERVTGSRPAVSSSKTSCERPIIIGTLGHSSLVDKLAADGKLDNTDLHGKWESFVVTTIDDPIPGVKQALVIAGSDRRGTIYGIYELSEQLGVSPWYWWADVPAKKRTQAYVVPGRYASGEPAVKYRGIFINDEEPCFGPWAREKFGGINSKMYAHMFELILRLRGNYLWPAMWGKAFNEDDPENPRLADEYGIVMGTSHHEPMLRAQQEWTKRSRQIGNGQWNYATNEQGLKGFWTEGIKRNKDYESIVTIGMRGDGDEPMIEGGDMEANVKLLEKIVADQRKILSEYINPDVTQVPQLWALYKEVADYYEHGMRVPDDVTLLWCDDNWGNIRRLPTPQEHKPSGGAGIYYHFDYVGSPRCYKWINTNPLPKIWEQMNLAYEYGADRIWIVNVGDLKPMELPIDFFMRMAWNPRALPKEKIGQFTRQWAEREFGPEHAEVIADIVARYAKCNGWRKPELLEPNTFSLVNYLEAERVLTDWRDISKRAAQIYSELPEEQRDAFYELVLYPAKASAQVVEMYIAAARNRLCAQQGRASANAEAERVRELFAEDQQLSDAYHQLQGGKWNHMMAQTHIGYTSWRDPIRNVMPHVTEITIPDAPLLGVAVEGSENAWPGPVEPAVLPQFDSLSQQRRWIEVFRRGSQDFQFSVIADQPWVIVSSSSGTVGLDQRAWVEIDWDQVPAGEHLATVTVSRANEESVPVQVRTVRSDEFTRENVDAFGGLTGPVAIAAESATKNIPVGEVRWEKIPDYGRGASGMSVFPVTAESAQPPSDAPRLEYPVFLVKAGEVQVDLITGTGMEIQPDRGVRIAVSFDDQEPQVIDAFAGQNTGEKVSYQPSYRDWDKWVKDSVRVLSSSHDVSSPGVHTLKVWMVDPAVVLESLIIHRDELPNSYFGPPVADGSRLTAKKR